MAATIIAIIQAAPIFELDHNQRGNRTVTAWVTHLVEHLVENVLPNLPEPFGHEYLTGNS
jgi:hypothetical protein